MSAFSESPDGVDMLLLDGKDQGQNVVLDALAAVRRRLGATVGPAVVPIHRVQQFVDR